MEWDGMVVIQLQHVSDAGFRLKCAKKDLPLTMHLHLHLQHSRAYLLIILAFYSSDPPPLDSTVLFIDCSAALSIASKMANKSLQIFPQRGVCAIFAQKYGGVKYTLIKKR